MRRVAFAGELAGEIRIAFPIGEVRPGHGTIAAGCEAAVRQCIGEDVTGGFFEFGATGEVSTPMRGVAPRPIFGPMPGSHAELGIVTVSDWPPSG